MSADEPLFCWRCGTALAADLLPLRREEPCPACDADLHVCRMCRFFNPSVADACDEPVAGAVGNKERANFCDYFAPSPRAHVAGAASADQRAARAALDALFGDEASTPPSTDPGRNADELKRLFGLDDDA
ncbi:MAG: hypothetical protein ACU85V_05875 [Gammaproteobacteria bacterium]